MTRIRSYIVCALLLLSAAQADAGVFTLARVGGSLGFGYQDYFLDKNRFTAFQTRLMSDFSSFFYDPNLISITGGITLFRTNVWDKGARMGAEMFDIGYNLELMMSPRKKIPLGFFLSQYSSDVGSLTSPLYHSLVTNYGATAYVPLGTLFTKRINLPVVSLRVEEVREKVEGSLRPGRSHDDRASLRITQGFSRTRYSGLVEANKFINDTDNSGYDRIFATLENTSSLAPNTMMYLLGRLEDRRYRSAGGFYTPPDRTYGTAVNLSYSPRMEYNGALSYSFLEGMFLDSRYREHNAATSINLLHTSDLTSTHNIYYIRARQEGGGMSLVSQTEGLGSQLSFNRGFRPFTLQSFYRLGLQGMQTTPGDSSSSMGQGLGLQFSKGFGQVSAFLGYELAYNQALSSGGARSIGHTGNVGANGQVSPQVWGHTALYLSHVDNTIGSNLSGYDSASWYLNMGYRWVGWGLTGAYSKFFPGGTEAGSLSGSLMLTPPIRGLSIDIQAQFQLFPSFAYTPRLKAGVQYLLRQIILKGSYEYNQGMYGAKTSHIVFLEVIRRFSLWP